MRGGPGDVERRQRWGRLFEELDRNKDGRVDVNELRQGLARLGGGDSDRGAQQVPPQGPPPVELRSRPGAAGNKVLNGALEATRNCLWLDSSTCARPGHLFPTPLPTHVWFAQNRATEAWGCGLAGVPTLIPWRQGMST